MTVFIHLIINENATKPLEGAWEGGGKGREMEGGKVGG